MNVSVGIAAYNAEDNISRLLSSILKQKQIDFKLEKIIIYSDSSTDKTASKVRRFNDSRLKLIETKQRSGFAYVLTSILKINKSPILVTLNDDVIINDNLFLNKLVYMFMKDKSLGLVSSNLKPLPSINFIQTAAASGFKAYNRMATSYHDGSNLFSCDGKSLVLSDKFIKKLEIPKNLSKMGNVDAYIYLSCIAKGYTYKQSKKTLLMFKLPSTTKEFVKWQSRNMSNYYLLKKSFGKIVDQEYKIPFFLFSYTKFTEFLKNPLGSIYIYFLGIYCSLYGSKNKNEFSPTWDLISTTKDIKVIANI